LWSNRNGETRLVEPLANVGKSLGNWACRAFCGVWGMVKVVWLFGGVNDCLGLCGLLWSMGNGEACVEPLASVGKCLGNWACRTFCGV
jgi:hypothetical protein